MGTYLEGMPTEVPFRWGREEFRMREIKASVEDVVGEGKVSAKAAPLEKKKIQSTKSFFIWQFPHAFDHTSRQAL